MLNSSKHKVQLMLKGMPVFRYLVIKESNGHIKMFDLMMALGEQPEGQQRYYDSS